METELKTTEAQADSHPPRIALLGWCDRYFETTLGHPLLWHINLAGVSTNKVTHFYPISLEGQHLLVAIYGARVGEKFVMEFGNVEANRTVNLEVTVLEMQTLDPITSQLTAAPDGVEFPGWTLRVIKVNKEFMVMEPGRYDIYLTSSALEQACRDFQEILNRNADEEEVQQFLESHPVSWHSCAPTRLMFKKPVLTKYVSGFVILNERKELLLVEIEKPGIGLIKDDGAIRHELQHAIAQVNDWIQVFNEHRAAALDCIGLKIDDVEKVKGLVIAGRTPSDSQANRLLRSWNWDDISFQTFDDLLHQTREVVRHIASV